MDLELYSVLSLIIVVASVVTVVFAFFAYLAFRVRQKASMRRPVAVKVPEATEALPEPEFFRPYVPKRLR